MVKKIRQLIQEVKKETGWDEFEKELKDTKTDVDQTFSDLKKDMDITPELKSASQELNKSLNGVKKDLKQTEKEVNQKQ